MYFVLFGRAFSIPIFTGAVLCAGALITLVFGKILQAKVRNSYEKTALAVYFAALSLLVALPVGKIIDGRAVVTPVENSVNLAFDLLRFLRHEVFLGDFLLNLIMLVPFGFLAGLLLKRFWLAASICLLVSLFLESLQLISVSRVSDINDVVYNFVGAVAGLAAGTFVRAPEAKA